MNQNKHPHPKWYSPCDPLDTCSTTPHTISQYLYIQSNPIQSTNPCLHFPVSVCSTDFSSTNPSHQFKPLLSSLHFDQPILPPTPPYPPSAAKRRSQAQSTQPPPSSTRTPVTQLPGSPLACIQYQIYKPHNLLFSFRPLAASVRISKHSLPHLNPPLLG